MPDRVKTRRYVSPRREEQARHTRAAIVATAQQLFGAKGYGRTRVDDIASEAGVAVQTVYSAIGGKRDLLWAVIETAVAGDDEPITVHERLRGALEGVRGRRVRLRRAIALGRQIMERSADAHRILRSAAGADATVAEVFREAEARRRADMTSLADLIADPDGFDPPDGRQVAADLLFALGGYEVYEHLVGTCRWADDRYDQWVTGAIWPAFQR